ncbi:hypothetical protein CEXT_550871 [Caerostris extrusa]|uniref:Uncharacterized protein n=1 Tax=Caerostris extrusa TaxID=172846 RepID=A0AAV4U3M6_CAEEX|nr:hypothetical protein CEXT_550871 [Caerostris extrusa]
MKHSFRRQTIDGRGRKSYCNNLPFPSYVTLSTFLGNNHFKIRFRLINAFTMRRQYLNEISVTSTYQTRDETNTIRSHKENKQIPLCPLRQYQCLVRCGNNNGKRLNISDDQFPVVHLRFRDIN